MPVPMTSMTALSTGCPAPSRRRSAVPRHRRMETSWPKPTGRPKASESFRAAGRCANRGSRKTPRALLLIDDSAHQQAHGAGLDRARVRPSSSVPRPWSCSTSDSAGFGVPREGRYPADDGQVPCVVGKRRLDVGTADVKEQVGRSHGVWHPVSPLGFVAEDDRAGQVARLHPGSCRGRGHGPG